MNALFYSRNCIPKDLTLWIVVTCTMLIASSASLHSQSWMPVITNESGKIHPYSYPIPDSAYVHDELIIKFREGTLNRSRLCYVAPSLSKSKDRSLQTVPVAGGDTTLKRTIMAQRFTVDSTIILDSALLAGIKSIGGIRLRRITSASPCEDTISITRYGDTIPSDDYNWMVLELDNNMNTANAAVALTIFYQDVVEVVSPNFLYHTGQTPNDQHYVFGLQTSLSGLVGMEPAWDHQVGKYEIKVGVIDNGLDFRHCDLGGQLGLGMKVSGGWSWTHNSADFSPGSNHGTPVAGIVGALTNGGCIGAAPPGVAGIAGGWGPTDIGSQLMGFQVTRPDDPTGRQLSTDYIIAAIREASAYNPATGYGYGCHILNNSYWAFEFDPAVNVAVVSAYELGVSFVGIRGNAGVENLVYPGCYEERMVINVGGGGRFKHRMDYSSFGTNMDIIAPAGSRSDPDEQIVWTTQIDNDYTWFDGTSAAAPHAAGVVALLRSYAIDYGIHNYLYPEDYDGMLKASAQDQNGGEDELAGYDEVTGWGHLQADRIFEMLADGYKVKHYTYQYEQNLNFSFGAWSDRFTMHFSNTHNGSRYLQPNVYSVRRRVLNGSLAIPVEWNNNGYPLFVWGSGGGKKGLGGFSYAAPNRQLSWTIVRSGRGNNSGNDWQAGIRHNHSWIADGETVQYEVWDTKGNYIGLFPPTADLAMTISVFGRELFPTSGLISDNGAGELQCEVFPNPAKTSFTLRYNLASRSVVTVNLYNALGEEVASIPEEKLDTGTYVKQIPVGELPPGLYICKVSANGRVVSERIVVD